MDSKCNPTLATLAWRHMPILILRSSDCAWYQGWRPSGSVNGKIHRGSSSATANSGDSQSISVYGLKFRRTDPSDSVASMSTYSASSRTSILRRQRRTIRVLSIPSPPTRFTFGHLMSRQYRRYRELARLLPSAVVHTATRALMRCGSHPPKSARLSQMFAHCPQTPIVDPPRYRVRTAHYPGDYG